MSMMEVKPPPRPYTEYNIFFQIEREYILQNLGVIPSLNSGEAFSTADSNYDGPELPPRYQGIILPADWYIPGKKHRKKRQHRASHGKISFTDLSKGIASSWRNIDGETKLFCAQLSDIGMQKYKREMQRYKNIKKQSESNSPSSSDSESKKPKKSVTKKRSHSAPKKEAFKEAFMIEPHSMSSISASFNPNTLQCDEKLPGSMPATTQQVSMSSISATTFKHNNAPAEKTPISFLEEKIIVTRHPSQPSDSARASLSHNKPGVSTSSYSPAMALSSSALSASWPSTNPSHLAQFNPFVCGVCKSDENNSESRKRSGSTTVEMHDDDILNMWKNH